MKRPDPTETALDALREIRLEPQRFDLKRDLPPFLKHRSNQVVAKAAKLASPDLVPELVEAFRRLIPDGVKRDQGCVALTAIATALMEMEDATAEVYFAGIRHFQIEPAYLAPVDTAAQLRGTCAMALVQMGHPEALLEAVNLLVDPEPEARIGALRALSGAGKAEAELVLRHKALSGDKKSEVTAECFAALVRLGPRSRALPFVAEFIAKGREETAEGAAIALGESRSAEALPLLKDAFARESNPTVKSAILLGLALSRQEEAIEFLVDRVANDRERIAAAAIEGLALYKNDDALRSRLLDVVGRRKLAALEAAWRQHFG